MGNDIVTLIGGLLVIFCTLINYIVLTPFREQVQRLSVIIDKLVARLEAHDKDMRDLDNRITANEQNLKAVNRRLDSLEGAK